MFKKPYCLVIALEEHYWDAELAKHYTGIEAGRPGEISTRLHDLGELRLKEMDAADIDIQVLSHGARSTQKLPADIAVEVTRGVNDRLAAACAKHPARVVSIAALTTAEPTAAAGRSGRAGT